MHTAVIGRKPNNEPFMGFLEEVESDEPNGVTITVPTSENYRYSNAVFSEDFFLGWEPGSIKVDGRIPEISVHNEKQ